MTFCERGIVGHTHGRTSLLALLLKYERGTDCTLVKKQIDGERSAALQFCEKMTGVERCDNSGQSLGKDG